MNWLTLEIVFSLVLPGRAGLVTEWTQQQKGTSANGATTAETFAYTYDKAGRLTNSVRYLGTATTSDNKLTEQGIVYDRSGNVTADPQGSMSVAWNVLDLPRTLTSGSASTQRAYLADGTLAQVYDGSTTRIYLGDMVFTRTGTSGTPALESAAWEGGRLLAGTGTDKVLYYVTDHLGSVRTIKDGAGTIRQRYDYYPFGTVSRVYTSSSTTDYSLKRYRFGGKEIAGSALTEPGGTGAAPAAPYLDFGARLYSPRTATWLSVDPMAEKYYGIGPHVYCAASPLNLVDPEGLYFSDNSVQYVLQMLIYACQRIEELNALNAAYFNNPSMFQSEITYNNGLIKEFYASIDEIGVMIDSNQEYSIIPSGKYNLLSDNIIRGASLFNEKTGVFEMVVPFEGGMGLLAHEMKHGYQFEIGEFSNITKLNYDLEDEYEAYYRQEVYGGEALSKEEIDHQYPYLSHKNIYFKQQIESFGPQKYANKVKASFRINGVTYRPQR